MTRDEVIEEACAILALAFHSIGDYTEPSDGFCRKCPAQTSPGWNFQHSGKTLDYIRQAVARQLRVDGYKIDSNFDPITGRAKEGKK